MGGVALLAAMSAGCATGGSLADKPTVQTQAVVVISSPAQNVNEPEPEPEPEAAPEPEWTPDRMMMACGRG